VFFAEHFLATDLLVDVAFGVEHYQGVGLSEVAVNYGDMADGLWLDCFLKRLIRRFQIPINICLSSLFQIRGSPPLFESLWFLKTRALRMPVRKLIRCP
jgi:hypothetical protein